MIYPLKKAILAPLGALMLGTTAFALEQHHFDMAKNKFRIDEKLDITNEEAIYAADKMYNHWVPAYILKDDILRARQLKIGERTLQTLNIPTPRSDVPQVSVSQILDSHSVVVIPPQESSHKDEIFSGVSNTEERQIQQTTTQNISAQNPIPEMGEASPANRDYRKTKTKAHSNDGHPPLINQDGPLNLTIAPEPIPSPFKKAKTTDTLPTQILPPSKSKIRENEGTQETLPSKTPEKMRPSARKIIRSQKPSKKNNSLSIGKINWNATPKKNISKAIINTPSIQNLLLANTTLNPAQIQILSKLYATLRQELVARREVTFNLPELWKFMTFDQQRAIRLFLKDPLNQKLPISIHSQTKPLSFELKASRSTLCYYAILTILQETKVKIKSMPLNHLLEASIRLSSFILTLSDDRTEFPTICLKGMFFSKQTYLAFAENTLNWMYDERRLREDRSINQRKILPYSPVKKIGKKRLSLKIIGFGKKEKTIKNRDKKLNIKDENNKQILKNSQGFSLKHLLNQGDFYPLQLSSKKISLELKLPQNILYYHAASTILKETKIEIRNMPLKDLIEASIQINFFIMAISDNKIEFPVMYIKGIFFSRQTCLIFTQNTLDLMYEENRLREKKTKEKKRFIGLPSDYLKKNENTESKKLPFFQKATVNQEERLPLDISLLEPPRRIYQKQSKNCTLF